MGADFAELVFFLLFNDVMVVIVVYDGVILGRHGLSVAVLHAK